MQEKALKPMDSFKECDLCPVMVVVPAGVFRMGSPDSDNQDGDEGPQRQVTIARPFAVGKFEVTVDQFAAFVAETGHDAGSTCWTFEAATWSERTARSFRNPGFTQSSSHPAVCINWRDAKAYVAWLSSKTGRTYRLLTEAEWEYAARAGTISRYHFGDDANALCGYGNAADQSTMRGVAGASGWAVVTCDDGHAFTAPAGSFSANAFGLYDLHGNVWEWTEDCWNDSYDGAPVDGSAWTTGDCSFRVIRGGSWINIPRGPRSANRYREVVGGRFDSTGFRVARTLSP